jgi:hypothetical protein
MKPTSPAAGGEIMETMRRCKKCRIEKMLDKFRKKAGGYYSWTCKDCYNQERGEYRNSDAYKLKQSGLKTCVGCKEVKPLVEFDEYKNSAGNRSFRSRCKPCFKTYNQEYSETHKEQRNEISRQWARENAERIREQSRQRYAQDPERFRQKAQEWRADNLHVKADGESRRRARLRDCPRIEKINRYEIIKRDNATCYLCLRRLPMWAITLDHVIPLAKGGSHITDNLRVACRSCNSSKGARLLEEITDNP